MLQHQLSKALQTAITPAVTQHLAHKGYAVVDNLFGKNIADELRVEVVKLFQDGHMHKNCTHLVREGQTQLLEKAQIHEAELTLDPGIQAKTPLCSQLNSDRTLATMLSLHMPQVRLDSQDLMKRSAAHILQPTHDNKAITAASLCMDPVQAIKLQYNSGQGGCFPMHLDTDEMLDGRKVTAIFYLNPNWDASQGGHLKLYPWPDPPIEIHPRHDRLVMFSSARMLHRVTPSYTNNDTHHGENSAVSRSKPRADSRANQTSASMQHTQPVSSDRQDLQNVSRPETDFGNQRQNEVDGRCCFTIWLAQNAGRHRRNSNNNKPQLSSLQPSKHPSEDPDAAARFLLHPYVRPHVLKLVYEDEWMQSIKDSHPPGPALDALLLQQANEVAVIRRALSKYESFIKEMTFNPDIAGRNRMSWF